MIHDAIILETAAHFSVSVEDILSRKRDRRTSRARHAACFVIRQLYPQPTYREISNALGRNTHVASLRGVRNTEHLMATDQRFLDLVCRIIERTHSTAS